MIEKGREEVLFGHREFLDKREEFGFVDGVGIRLVEASFALAESGAVALWDSWRGWAIRGFRLGFGNDLARRWIVLWEREQAADG